MTDGRWLVEVRGHAIPIDDHELDLLAEKTAFRLEPEAWVDTPAGVGIRMKGTTDEPVIVHFCFTSQIEDAIETLAVFLPPGRHALLEDE